MLSLKKALPATIAACVLLAPAAAQAAPTLGAPIDLTGTPGRITQGPDGNIWVLMSGGNNEIAKITPAGVKTEFDVATLAGAVGLTGAPDGNLWATKSNAVVKVPPANPAGATDTPIAGFDAQEITAGPLASVWAGSGRNLHRIPTANPAGNDAIVDALKLNAQPRSIAAGTDGRLWLSDGANDEIVAVTTAGTPTSFATGSGMQGIAAGPNGQVAAAQPNAADTNIWRAPFGTTAQKTKIGDGTDPFGMTFGPDGAYWIAQFAMGKDSIGRLTPAGQYTQPFKLPNNSGPRRITAGPGNTLWVSLEGSKQVLPVRGVTVAAGGGGGTAPKDTKRPSVTSVKLSRKRFAVGKAVTPISAQVKRGTTIRFSLSEAGRVAIRIDRRLAGRRVKGKCRKPTRKNRTKRKCARYKRAGASLRRAGKAGANSVAFSGRIGRKALKPGRYRMTIVATDAAGNKSRSSRASFRIVRVKKAKKG